MDAFGTWVIEHGAEHPVLGTHEQVPVDLERQRIASTTDPRIHDDQVQRARRKPAIAALDPERGGADVLRCDRVCEVYERRPGKATQDCAFHYPNVRIGDAEVSEQGDDPAWPHRTCAPSG